MYYTKEQIIEKCERASKDMKLFYKADFVNYRGRTKEKEYYTEIVSKWLLDNIDVFDRIETMYRELPYNTGHEGGLGEKTNRIEEYLAKQIFNSHLCYPEIGTIIDYQTPLKAHNDSDNRGLGKIDLLSVNDSNHSVYILELKKSDSEETMLRCVLEAYTYLRIVSREKLLKDFGLPADYVIKASPLVFFNRYQHQEYIDPKREYLRQLMKVLNSTPFFIDEIPAHFTISK